MRLVNALIRLRICAGWVEPLLVAIPLCWKSHVTFHMCKCIFEEKLIQTLRCLHDRWKSLFSRSMEECAIAKSCNAHTEYGIEERSLQWLFEGSFVRVSLEALCCVLDQGTLSSAKYWSNSGNVLT